MKVWLLLVAGTLCMSMYTHIAWSASVIHTKIPSQTCTLTDSSQNNYLVKGHVTDERGISLPGVTIRIDDTQLGTATDKDGNFSLKVFSKTGLLTVSFIGYKTQKIPYVYNVPVNLKMLPQTSELDEVTVVAFGKQNTREVVGSVASISKEKLNVGVSNFTSLIQGAAAGVSVVRASNSPGGGGISTEIRGKSSLAVERESRNSEPLYIVDGVPLYNNVSEFTGQSSLADINPDDIERIDIQKDAAATALYGSRGANGVIIITTKKGSFNQKPIISANVTYSYAFNATLPVMTGGNRERLHRIQALRNYKEAGFNQDANRYLYENSYEGSYNDQLAYDYFWNKGYGANVQALQDSLNPFYNNSTNLFKYFFRNAKTIDANLQVRGGSSNVAYTVGLGYYDEEGLLKNTGFGRLKLSSNIQIKPADNFKINFGTDIVRTTRKRSTAMGNNFPTGDYLEKVPNILMTYSTLMPGPGNSAFEESMRIFNETKEKLESYRLRSNVSVAYNFLPGFELKSLFAIDYSQSNSNTFYPSATDEYKESRSIGQIGRNLTWVNDNLLTYSWNNELFDLNVLLGASFQSDESNQIKGWARNAPSDLIHYASWYGNVYDIDGQRNLKDFFTDYSKSTLVGVYSRLNLNYKQKYLLSASVRRDASSRFGENVRWATFPSGAVGYAFTEESFMNALKPILSYGKLRLSYGKTGRQFSQPYVAAGILKAGDTFLGNPSVVPEWFEGLQNRTLTWEECKQFDVGIDLEFLERKVMLTFDYYHKFTDKILYNVTLPGNYSGYSKQWRNAYAISNRGFELQIKWDVIRTDKLFWNLSFNVASNRNILEKSEQNRDFQITSSVISENFNNNINVVGKPINGLYVYKVKGIYDYDYQVPYIYANGRKIYLYGDSNKQYYQAGDRIIENIDHNENIISSPPGKEDRYYVGDPNPKAWGGISSTLKWKRWDFNVNGFFSFGGYILNLRKGASVGTDLTNPVLPVFENLKDVTFWENPGDNADYPKNVAGGSLLNFATNTSANITKTNYFKIRSVSIGYRFPELWGTDVYVSVIGENLWTLTNYKGGDPETHDPLTGADNADNIPMGKIIRAKIQITLNKNKTSKP